MSIKIYLSLSFPPPPVSNRVTHSWEFSPAKCHRVTLSSVGKCKLLFLVPSGELNTAKPTTRKRVWGREYYSDSIIATLGKTECCEEVWFKQTYNVVAVTGHCKHWTVA
jgi:hypothetical protein